MKGGVTNIWPVKPFETVMVIKGYTNKIELNCLSFLPYQGMLGIFFSAKSAVLIEDVPFTEEDIRNE